MPAPVSIRHIHVQALRVASGAEALVARVLTADGVAGFGFSFGTEAYPARDMAAWDAAARGRGVPLHALFGKRMRERVAIVLEQPGPRRCINPFEDLLDEARSRAQADDVVTLLAPNAHPWELSYCAALAASVAGDVRIAVPHDVSLESITVPDTPGIAIAWTAEPAFAAMRWHPLQR
jgi:hypothetical protein